MKDMADLMETPVVENTIFKCTAQGCGCQVQVTHAPERDAAQPFTCCCGGAMEQVSTGEPIAGG